MARYRGTTAERGLGTAHQNDRKRLLALHREGDPCWRCGKPMYKSQGLDRDHIIDRALGGAQGPAVLAHRSCNRSAGAKLGNRLQPRIIMAGGRDTICTTCGKPYSRAPRFCEICGAHYHPNHGEQRSCSRACGTELRRRIYGPSGSRRTPKPKPAPRPRRAGPVASGQREPKGGWPAVEITYYTCRYCGTVGTTKASARQPREVCPARPCQLARIAANNLRARNGLTPQEANAAVAAYVAQGDHRQAPAMVQTMADKKWSQTVTAIRRATERATLASRQQ